MDGYIEGCFSRCIVHHAVLDALEDGFSVIDIHAQNPGAYGIGNGRCHGCMAVSRNDHCGRRVAPARMSIIGDDLDDQVFGCIDAAQCRDKGRLQGNTYDSHAYICDFHKRIPPFGWTKM